MTAALLLTLYHFVACTFQAPCRLDPDDGRRVCGAPIHAWCVEQDTKESKR